MSSLTSGPWTVEEKKADYQTDEGDKYHTIEYIIRGIDQSSSQYIARVNRKEDAVAIVSVLDLLEALQKARRTIRTWHGEAAWDLYQSSPEMLQINGAIKNAGGKVGA